MTAPLNLATLKALHEVATPKHGRARIPDVDENFARWVVAAHTHWLELLAMAEQRVDPAAIKATAERMSRYAEEREHYRTKCFEYLDRAEKAEAEKAAMAERLEVATEALRAVRRQGPEYGRSRTYAFAGEAIARISGIAAIAAHEAERGKE